MIKKCHKLKGIPSMGDQLLSVFKVLLEANRLAVSLLDDKVRRPIRLINKTPLLACFSCDNDCHYLQN